MAATCFKQVGTGAKGWENCGMLQKNTCLEHSTGSWVTVDSIMIRDVKGAWKALSFRSKDWARFNTLWNTWIYDGYYYMGSGTPQKCKWLLCVFTYVLQSSLFIYLFIFCNHWRMYKHFIFWTVTMMSVLYEMTQQKDKVIWCTEDKLICSKSLEKKRWDGFLKFSHYYDISSFMHNIMFFSVIYEFCLTTSIP